MARRAFGWRSLGVFTVAFIYALAALVRIDRGGSGKAPLVEDRQRLGLSQERGQE